MTDAAAPLEERLRGVEGQLAGLKARRPDWTDVAKALGSWFSGVVVVIAAYFLTGSVNNAISRQQLQLSNVREMRELLIELGKPESSAQDREAAAITLSAFGRAAVAPLINLLESGSETQVPAAMKGLRAIALTEPEAVCEGMARVIDNRTRLFSWETHLWVIGLVGELNCRDLGNDMERYAALVSDCKRNEDLSAYSSIVRPSPAPGPGALMELERALKESLTLLLQQARHDADR